MLKPVEIKYLIIKFVEILLQLLIKIGKIEIFDKSYILQFSKQDKCHVFTIIFNIEIENLLVIIVIDMN